MKKIKLLVVAFVAMFGYGQVAKNDTEAIAGVFKTIADAVESINLSIVMTKATKAL